MTFEYELEEKKQNLKPDEELEVSYRVKKKEKKPPYINVGNGFETRDFPAGVSLDTFKVFSELSKAQQRLFVDFKDLLVDQRVSLGKRKQDVDKINVVTLYNDDEWHLGIKKQLKDHKNGTELEEKGVLKKIKNGRYMLNPYIFIPRHNFEEVAEIWNELNSQ